MTTYQKQLDALVPPRQLFHIDGLVQRYTSLKREYSEEWNKYETYQIQMKTNSKQMPSDDIQLLINNLTKLQTSAEECLADLVSDLVSDLVTDLNGTSGPTTPLHTGPVSVDLNTEYQPLPIPSQLTAIQSKSPPLINRSTTEVYEYDNPYASPVQEEQKTPFSATPMQYQVRNMGPLNKKRSVRSFGSMFSIEFQCETATHYQESIVSKPRPFGVRSKAKGSSNNADSEDAEKQKIVQYFHDNYYGQNEVFQSAFGARPVIYCDWTASGKVLECVEQYLSKEMYTLYANTHTTTSITGTQTSAFRAEARSIVLSSLKGDANEDVIIFTGSGVTGAIYKMANILMNSLNKCYKPESTVVFVSIYEHNSNIYIWKELGIQVVVIPEDAKKGALNLGYLEKKLKLYAQSHLKQKYNLLIGSFTAASNVSGIIAPVDECTELLHKYGALSFWDYATAGPYLDVNMTNKSNPMLSKDAVFISTHKYLAGPGAPGILCAKKTLFQNYIPVIPGGGTVFAAYGVADGQWEYLSNVEEREEGGTPDIIGSVRAAFSFLIKDHLSTEFITNREERYLSYFLAETKGLKNLNMMGNTKCPRLPVLSFLITHNAHNMTKYLHYNYIAALLNDLFGIQGRGGCACAGMYGVECLELTDNQVEDLMAEVREDSNELARPGYFRINLHYTLNEKELEYIVHAVRFVCEHGWKFLPLYDVNKHTGNYFHRDMVRKPDLLKNQLRSLLDVSFDEKDGAMKWIQRHMRVDGKQLNENLDKFFVAAHDILNNLEEYLPSKEVFGNEDKISNENATYWLPSQLYEDVLLWMMESQIDT
eukprot:242609_1